MFWLFIVVGIAIYLYTKSAKKAPVAARVVERMSEVAAVPKISFTVETAQFDPQEWERERAKQQQERQQERALATDKLIANFKKPLSLAIAFEDIEKAVAAFATASSVPAPNFERLREQYLVIGDKKTELLIRKEMNAEYKLRDQAIHRSASLALCVIHARFMKEHPNSEWKISSSLKRLISNLRHEKYRGACIGFLYLFREAVHETDAELSRLCDDQIAGLFSAWYSDDQQKLDFTRNLEILANAKSASHRHFAINPIVEYLEKRLQFDPSVREQLISLCEEDILTYKPFLSGSHSVSLETPNSFRTIVKSENYFCPRLPGFDALWTIYESEGNRKELERLHKLGVEIRYAGLDVDDSLETESTDKTQPDPTSKIPITDPCPVEMIEVEKSGQKGKSVFLDSSGHACSTEEVVVDNLKQSGHKVLRGEVTFWQAMFALAFWEEIFEGTGAPSGFNDIPTDLFSGEQFYSSRASKIEKKFLFLRTANIAEFITTQLRKHANEWTRIIDNGVGNGDFSYRQVLAGTDVIEFLQTIEAETFAKIVFRIAKNPTENRAGTPDYSVWKGTSVFFVEVKGVREQIRESQAAWLAWMISEGIDAKVIRVKGKAKKTEQAA